MSASIVKNHDGQLYLKEDLKVILNTPELKAIKSSQSVLFFSDNVSLERVKETLKVISIVLDDLIKKESMEKKEE
jgi:hypothetical protein